MYIVLGKTGYIGSEFVKYFTNNNIPFTGYSRSELNYTDIDKLENHLASKKYNPLYSFWKIKGIINCAGFVGKPNVDACEAAKEETLLGNSVLPGQLAAMCKRLDIPFIQISSGCIFSGYDKDFTENDRPNFTFDTGSFYSGSKALGEHIIASENKESYIFRLRIPFDSISSPRNYITKLLSYNTLLNARNSISHRGDFVKACIDIVRKKAPYGIYNITNPGSIDTEEVIDMVKKYLAPDKEFTFFDDEDDFMTNVKAPRSNCVLDTSKAEAVLGKSLRCARDAMVESIKQYR